VRENGVVQNVQVVDLDQGKSLFSVFLDAVAVYRKFPKILGVYADVIVPEKVGVALDFH
jgi:hypothetical protein